MLVRSYCENNCVAFNSGWKINELKKYCTVKFYLQVL